MAGGCTVSDTGSGPDTTLDKAAAALRAYVLRYAQVRDWTLVPVHRVVGGSCTCGGGCAAPGKHIAGGGLGVGAERGRVALEAGDFGEWAAGPRNVGLVCGSASGVVGVNIQRDEGLESWRRLVQDVGGGDVGGEATLSIVSGNGGEIRLYALPAGLTVVADRLALDDYPGVSILGDGSYALLPPSVTGVAGVGAYEWSHGANPAEHPIAPLPSGLVGLLSGAGAVFGGVVDQDDPYSRSGNRSCTDIGNGRRLVDEWGTVISYTAGIGWRYWTDQHRWVTRLADEAILEKAKKIPEIVGAERRAMEDALRDLTAVVEAEAAAEAAALAAGAVAPERTVAPETLDWLQGQITQRRRWEHQSRSLGTVTAAKKAAGTDPRILRAPDTWDRDPFLLGVPNGMLDLRDGSLWPMERSRWISKYGSIAYEPGASRRTRCPDFWNFIEFITAGDEEYARQLQLWAGYSLTGSMREKALLFCPGPGNTGKTTFADALSGVAGDYAVTLDERLVNLQERSGNTETSTLPLLGARIAVAADIPVYDFNSGLLKKISGGDQIAGRAMHQNQISFVTPAKLWIFSNHFPAIRDKQLMERLRVLPFENVSRDTNRRRSLWTKPESWTEGVGGVGGNAMMRAMLDWAVEGAREALALEEIPTSARSAAAKERYEANSDILIPYLRACARIEDGLTVDVQTLYDDYSRWCSTTSFSRNVPLRPAFENILTERGFVVTDGMVAGLTIAPVVVGGAGAAWGRAAGE